MPAVEAILKAKASLESMPIPGGFRYIYTKTGLHRVCAPGHYRVARRYRKGSERT